MDFNFNKLKLAAFAYASTSCYVESSFKGTELAWEIYEGNGTLITLCQSQLTVKDPKDLGVLEVLTSSQKEGAA